MTGAERLVTGVMEPPGAAPDPDMIWVPGGEFLMGSDRHYPEEAPAHRVAVAGFWMDRFQVTNERFRRFVRETGHVTLAQRSPNVADYAAAKPDLLVPGSTVFVQPRHPVDPGNHYNWWSYVPAADWRHPRGPASTIRGLSKHPVVHVAWVDVAPGVPLHRACGNRIGQATDAGGHWPSRYPEDPVRAPRLGGG